MFLGGFVYTFTKIKRKTEVNRFNEIWYISNRCKKVFRGVAQLASAPVWGTGGRRFESSHPDHEFFLHLQQNYRDRGRLLNQDYLRID